MSAKNWLHLGTIAPADLVAARLELHWAAQIPAALGIARAEPTADFAQHALSWDAGHGALVSAPVSAPLAHRAGLRLAEPALLLLGGRGTVVESLPLAGRTLREGLRWLEEACQRLTGTRAAPLTLPEHELPPHALADGAHFGANEPAHAVELARWFANLDPLLRTLTQDRAASPVRVWSHHFDLDTVLTLGGERTLGLGFSPGDDSYAEPYLYGLPTPYPDERALMPLPPPAEWVTDGWIGAVLRGSPLAARAPAEQAELAADFYRGALRVLGG